MPGDSSMQHCPPVHHNTLHKSGGLLDFDSPSLAEAEYRRRGNGIVGAGVPAKCVTGKDGSKLPLGPRAFPPREHPQANGSPRASRPRSRGNAPTEYGLPPGSGYARTRSK